MEAPARRLPTHSKRRVSRQNRSRLWWPTSASWARSRRLLSLLAALRRHKLGTGGWNDMGACGEAVTGKSAARPAAWTGTFPRPARGAPYGSPHRDGPPELRTCGARVVPFLAELGLDRSL